MTPDSPQKRSESPESGSERRFNPFVNEGDMFKIVLWVAGAALVLIVLLALAQTIF